jgi:hypothetical protein
VRRRLPPLGVPGFGRLLASYTVNEIGDCVAIVALSVLVYGRTGDPLATTALFLAMKFLPAFLAPMVVARVDQLVLRRVLPAIYLAEAAAFAGLALLASDFLLVAVLALALIDGTLALTGRALTRGAVAALLTPHDLLRDGNAALNVAFGLASVVGLAAGGIITSASGVATALWVDAASFLAVALLIATAGSELATEHAEREPFLARLRGGLGHARREPLVRALLGWQALALFFFTLIVPIEVVYAKETLGVGSAGFGVLVAAWSAGIVIGSLVFLRGRHGRPLDLVLGSTAAVGLGYVGMAAVDDLLAACLFSVLGGMGNGVQWVSVMTWLQESTPPELQARIAGLLESVGAATPGLGFLAGGALTALASPQAAYGAAGIGVLLLVLVAGVGSRRLFPTSPVSANSS